MFQFSYSCTLWNSIIFTLNYMLKKKRKMCYLSWRDLCHHWAWSEAHGGLCWLSAMHTPNLLLWVLHGVWSSQF